MSLETVVGEIESSVKSAIAEAAPVVTRAQSEIAADLQKAYQALGTFSYQLAYFESQAQSIKNTINALHVEENARVASAIVAAPPASEL